MGFAEGPFGPLPSDVYPLDDMGIRGEDALSLSHNCAMIETAPRAGAPTPETPQGLTTNFDYTEGGACVSIPKSPLPAVSPLRESISLDEARPYIVDMLDSIRRQQEALDVNRPRFMLLARKYGLRHREIAELLGMTESGVRQAVHRAKDTPGMEFGGAA